MTEPIAKERLAKALANAGVASRRASEELIRSGQVSVNGRKVTDPAFAVSSEDLVIYRDAPINLRNPAERIYIAFHKPLGVVSTMQPGKEEGPCLADIVQVPNRVFPVGRLDRDSSGLIILTDDGDLTLKLTHPRHQVEKEYHVKLHRPFIGRDAFKIYHGVMIEERPVDVRELGLAHAGRLKIVIAEGRNRIVRRLFGALKYNVLELKRVRIGPITLGRLGVGRWRKLTDREVEILKENANATTDTNSRDSRTRGIVRQRREG